MMGPLLHKLLERARDDAEVARVLTERHAAHDGEDLSEVRLWIHKAHSHLNEAEDQLDRIEENE